METPDTVSVDKTLPRAAPRDIRMVDSIQYINDALKNYETSAGLALGCL